ncbi:MAG: hypothetical protein E6I82_02970 [Chloroflexi bacterium]|nr:MAG: hypothetical protein E6I82_02970 [Chloroflexota bacterium]
MVERGKLYIHGGGWDTLFAATFPVVHPAMALALLLRLEYAEALKDIPITIELVDEDDHPVGVKIEGKVNVGHAAGTKPGQPIFVPQAITLNGLQLPREGSYNFRVTSDSRHLGSIVFRVVPAATMPPSMLPPGMLPPGTPPPGARPPGK